MAAGSRAAHGMANRPAAEAAELLRRHATACRRWGLQEAPDEAPETTWRHGCGRLPARGARRSRRVGSGWHRLFARAEPRPLRLHLRADERGCRVGARPYRRRRPRLPALRAWGRPRAADGLRRPGGSGLRRSRSAAHRAYKALAGIAERSAAGGAPAV